MPVSSIGRRSNPAKLGLLLLARMLFAGFLVFATYNPSGRSFTHWVLSDGPRIEWKLVATALLLVAHGVVIPVALRALGLGGVALVTSLTTTAIWVAMETGWLTIPAPDGKIWIGLSVLSVVIGVGLCWMTIGRTMDGQLRTVDLSRL